MQLILSSQLEKADSYAVDLTIVSNSGSPDEEHFVFRCIALHLRRLRSLRLTLEILHLDDTSVEPQWLKENLTHVESVTVSGRCSGNIQAFSLLKAFTCSTC